MFVSEVSEKLSNSCRDIILCQVISFEYECMQIFISLHTRIFQEKMSVS